MQRCWTTRIVTNPVILAGKPIIAGTCISVELAPDCIASGWSVGEVIEVHPHLTPDDVLAALSFAADVIRRKPFVTVAEIEASVAERGARA